MGSETDCNQRLSFYAFSVQACACTLCSHRITQAADLDKAYAAHASKQKPMEIGFPSLFDLEGGGGDANKLYAGLDAFARRNGGSSGDELLKQLTDTVEQTAALTCNMLAAAKLKPASLAPIAAEIGEALTGQAPDAPITPALLEAMPLLDALAKESLVSLVGSGASDPEGKQALPVSMAKAVYVQARRMFEEVIFGESPPCELKGSPLCTIGERVEVLCKPKMYYELQRGVKKLRF